MNFGKTDMYILVGSFMVIVFMTLVFPALGMANDTANESNVPELGLSESTVDFVGERPEYPNSPTSGELHYKRGIPTERKQTQLHNDGENEVFIETFCYSDDPANESCRVILSVFDTGGHADSQNHTLSESDFNNSNVISLSAQDNNSNTWETVIEFEQVKNWNTSNQEHVISWELVESPESSGIANIPIIGGIYSTADAIASVLAWGITVIFWFCTWFVELVINVLGMLAKLFIFAIRLVTYMIDNYSAMIDSVSGFATFILLFPVILLTVEFLKLGFIFIKILPTT